MLRGIDPLTRFQEEDPEAKSYNYNRTTIRASMVTRGIKLYNSAIAASIGSLLEGGDYRRGRYDGTEWIDLAGQYLPLGIVEQIMERIATSQISLREVQAEFDRLMLEYRDMAAAYAYGLLSQLTGSQPDDREVEAIIASSHNILNHMREATEADRQRDTGLDMMVGYGYDYREEAEQVADFRNTR
jgi:hypothetical protein